MPKQIELDSDFEAPALRAGLDVLFILARVLRNAFSDSTTIDSLESFDVDYINVAKVLGSVLADPQYSLSKTSDIADIWTAFFLHRDIKHLPDEPRSILERIRDEAIALAETQTDCIQDLLAANVQAHTLVKDILTQHGLQRLMPSTPVPIELKNDSAGTGYCCATSPLTGRIDWSHQVVSHALIGLIVADLIFSHEYLSHLVPRNLHLGHTIREQWLVSALVEPLRETPSYPRWKIRLWPAYRRMLEDHVSQSDTGLLQTFGYEGAEQASVLLYFTNPQLFWKLTAEMLEHEPDEDHAQTASWVAFRLVGEDPRTFSKQKISSLNELRATLEEQ